MTLDRRAIRYRRGLRSYPYLELAATACRRLRLPYTRRCRRWRRPDRGFMPWTPRLLEEFQKQKGYDLKPYIPLFFTCSPVFTVPIQASYGTEPYLPGLFTGKLTEEAQRAKADYWNVWSGMFRDSFFRV